MEWQRSFKRTGLGNQFFFYASLVGVAKRNGFTPVIPSYSPLLSILKDTTSETIVVDPDKYDLLISNGTDIPQHEVHSSFCCTYFGYTEKIHHVLDRDVVLRGAFQSWKYFHPDNYDAIRSAFTFREDIRAKAAAVLGSLLAIEHRRKTKVGLHIRRGDIMKSHLRKFGHIPAPKSYFDAAITYMSNRHPHCVFIVVSNDMPWAKNSLKSAQHTVMFAPDKLSPEVSLTMLTMMDHLIISVGTFSWWSAYLSNATDVVYFNGTPEPLSFYDVAFRAEDYYLPHWVGLS
ncbi:putative Galactoside [Hypsibius exemplaris]|uniref:L-Fucosyltransferase n=1 Tax=Hypsibius exemplaris TaxID=2072580 RepID=A0A9X6NC69_HYPEX|nr:putative Galactoside [Hypsibius exemplaris]